MSQAELRHVSHVRPEGPLWMDYVKDRLQVRGGSMEVCCKVSGVCGRIGEGVKRPERAATTTRDGKTQNS